MGKTLLDDKLPPAVKPLVGVKPFPIDRPPFDRRSSIAELLVDIKLALLVKPLLDGESFPAVKSLLDDKTPPRAVTLVVPV